MNARHFYEALFLRYAVNLHVCGKWFFPSRWFIPGNVHFAVYDFYLFLLHSLPPPPPLSLSLCFFLSLTRSLAPIFPHCISLIIVADCAVNTAIVKYSITAHWHPSRLQVDRFVFLYRTRWSNFLRKEKPISITLACCNSYLWFICCVSLETWLSITMNVGQDFSKKQPYSFILLVLFHSSLQHKLLSHPFSALITYFFHFVYLLIRS